MNSTDPDFDVQSMNRDEAKAEIVKLRNAIRRHRDAQSHDLCWFFPEMWSLLPEGYNPDPQVPPVPEFIHHCIGYRCSLARRPNLLKATIWLFAATSFVAAFVVGFLCGKL